ncbi:MAG: glutathione S-transferase family protein [Alphaproteobacteria bacterium]|nr:glutathione S-transferase family protein [Alphaproteobacteria bacterium]
MQAPFRLFGAELSPYSIKVRAYLRFKGLEHEWIARNMGNQAEFQRYAKLPLIPVLVDANDRAFQDSTPIIESLETQFPEPSILPDDAALRFVSALLEDYADEWLNKAMFHYRWSYEADQLSAAERLAQAMFADAEGVDVQSVAASVRERMMGRRHHVGSSADTAPVIEAAFTRLLANLEAHLASRAYLFGARPALADFGLAAQCAQLLSDPTPGAIMRAQAPCVVAWTQRTMNAASVEGAFESLDALAPTLKPILSADIAGVFLPWMAANADAMNEGAESLSLEIAGAAYQQAPQKYAARAYSELKAKRRAQNSDALAALLEETGCSAYLPGAAASEEPPQSEDDGGEPEDDASDDS